MFAQRRLRALAILLGVIAPAAAQTTPPVLGFAVDPAGEPVADATVTFYPTTTAPDWLAEHLAPPPTAEASTDARGGFRLPEAAPSGWLSVRTTDGLSALVARVAPGVPERVVLQPMAAITIPHDSELYLAAAGRRARYLGRHAAPEARVPAGEYLALIHTTDAWSLTAVRLGPGDRRTLPAPERSGIATAGDAASLAASPQGWPVTVSNDTGIVLPEALPTRLRLSRRHPGWAATHIAWVDSSGDLERVPLRTEAATLTVVDDERPVAGATVVAFDRGARGPLVCSVSTSGPDGIARAASAEYVAVWQPGRTLTVVAAARLGADRRVHAPTGSTLRVRVEAPDAHEVGYRVRLHHDDDPAIEFDRIADRRGQLHFDGLPPGTATLELLSPDGDTVTRRVVIPSESVQRLTPRRGLGIDGWVRFPGGDPAVGITLHLRDTTDVGPAHVTTTDERGRFSFHGLDTERSFTLRAEVDRDGQTWSAQLRGIQANDGTWELELRTEDPPPPHRRGGG